MLQLKIESINQSMDAIFVRKFKFIIHGAKCFRFRKQIKKMVFNTLNVINKLR